jgi:hypothetical protein
LNPETAHLTIDLPKDLICLTRGGVLRPLILTLGHLLSGQMPEKNFFLTELPSMEHVSPTLLGHLLQIDFLTFIVAKFVLCELQL